MLAIANLHGTARKGTEDGQVPYADWNWRTQVSWCRINIRSAGCRVSRADLLIPLITCLRDESHAHRPFGTHTYYEGQRPVVLIGMTDAESVATTVSTGASSNTGKGAFREVRVGTVPNIVREPGRVSAEPHQELPESPRSQLSSHAHSATGQGASSGTLVPDIARVRGGGSGSKRHESASAGV